MGSGLIATESAKPRFALDSNILVNSVDIGEAARHDSATVIIQRAARLDCVLPLQAISEFFVAVSRKRIMPARRAAELATQWLTIFSSSAVSASAIRSALADNLARRASYWDALLVATAAEAGCSLVLTEDMGDGSFLSGVQVHNPFTKEGGLTALTRQLLDI
jgi:predicted nucleic acid-binding protein